MSAEQSGGIATVHSKHLQGQLDALDMDVALDYDKLHSLALKTGCIVPDEWDRVHVGLYTQEENPDGPISRLPSRRGRMPDTKIHKADQPNLPAYMLKYQYLDVLSACFERDTRDAVATALHNHPDFNREVKKENQRTMLGARLGGLVTTGGGAVSLVGHFMTHEAVTENAGYGVIALGAIVVAHFFSKSPKKRTLPDVSKLASPLVLRHRSDSEKTSEDEE